MAVICIARELAANGDETGRELEKLTQYRYIEKNEIEQLLVKKAEAKDLLEYDEKKPGFWGFVPERRERYIHYLKTVIYEAAAEGNCIILGRGGAALLKGIPGVMSARLIAPDEVRIDRIKIARSCDEIAAEHQIRQSDHDRQGYYKYFFDLDWKNPDLYDLTLNTAHISPKASAEVIDLYRQRAISGSEEKNGTKVLQERRLTTAVIDHVVYTEGIRLKNISIEATGHTVSLTGVSDDPGLVEAISAAAKKVPGVESVENNVAVITHLPSG